MLVKTKDLAGPALDWAVCFANWLQATAGQAEQARQLMDRAVAANGLPSASTDWSIGGPILDRERIDTDFCHFTGPWFSSIGGKTDDVPEVARAYGSTSLIAGLRCFVISKFGDAMDIPQEFLELSA